MSEWIFVESAPLSQAQTENNARCLQEYFAPRGWTINAISALAGNMQAETTINPGRWENDVVGVLTAGFGLVGWTPASKLIDWIWDTCGSHDYTDGVLQCDRIIWELDNGQQYYPTANYPETFREFTKSTKPPGYLAKAFMLNYERPYNQTPEYQAYRAGLAEAWYTFYTGQPAPKNTPAWLLTVLAKSARRYRP